MPQFPIIPRVNDFAPHAWLGTFAERATVSQSYPR